MSTFTAAVPKPDSVKHHGLLHWFTTLDHKEIGKLYMVTSLFWFVVAGCLALAMRVQLARPNAPYLSPTTYNQTFTLHGTTMIFFVVVPVLLGFSVYFVPLMIGARDMAFPRLNSLGYWVFALGGFLLYMSYLFGGGGPPDAGWFSYAPLSDWPYSAAYGQDYWSLALLLNGIGTTSTGINLIVTIFKERTIGMTLKRMPMFVWMVLVNAFLIVISIPPLNATIVMLEADRRLNAHFFRDAFGGSPILYQHYFWLFGHPEVYIMILPAWGMISELVPVFSRKQLFGFVYVAAASVAIGFLSYGVWVHHMFVTPLPRPMWLIFSASSMLIAVPTGIKVFAWTATMWRGTIRLTTSMYFAIAFVLQFTLGGLSGVMFGTVPIDWQLTDTYFVVAHFHYVLFGGTVFAVLAGLYYWYPKITGKLLGERLGMAQFWGTVIGFNMTFFVQHFLGIYGMRRRVYTYAPGMPYWAPLNMVSTIGAFILAGSMLLLIINIFRSRKHGAIAGDNPWDGWTLEWATTSPPPEENFKMVPPITGRRPLWDYRHPEQADDINPGEAPILRQP
jgi:cytochrome c oxidase subunit I